MENAAIHVQDLVKSFRRPGGQERLVAVDHLSLTIDRGEVVAFLGPNGAGKSTTIDMILGLTSPDSGTVAVLGSDPRQAARSGRVGAVYQTGGLLPDFTVAETMKAIAATHGKASRVAPLIDRWGLASFAGTKVRKCSGGQQQRLRFALAMIPDPEILVLDEPTTGLDVESRRRFWQVMAEEADAGRTIMFATHYIEEADSFARRVVLISGGRIVADGPIDEVRASVTGSTVEATLDDPAAEAASLRGRHGILDVTVQGQRLVVRTDRPDDLARHLLTATDARGLLISTTTLEDAFVHLTSSDAPEAAA
ncbi:ABC transporter ATP-binding protein [Acidipropionibacterium timonense]|uniref:ABC transporter ATP-binding protein n=1 Tax=Acidipropionibacterium timonense TaxID=2161818 RepID=UPI001031FA34|nr:ABC transporter ATP-binding protein [Acidipropionibacterium timonense]